VVHPAFVDAPISLFDVDVPAASRTDVPVLETFHMKALVAAVADDPRVSLSDPY
jgi:hypothetical protein